MMRLMLGGSLTDRLKTTGPLPLEEAARIFNTLAPALDDAHAHGIIHRDLKPGNILFDSRNQPYLSDFGIVKLSEGSAAFTGSAIIGTPAYMSPEQAKGERNIDGRSDLYALGAILFETLTGKLPYEADTPMGIAIKHIVEPVPRILDTNPKLPAACESIISRAMAKDRTDRFANAQAMAAMLATVARGESLPATTVVSPKEAAPTPAITAAAATVAPATTVAPSPIPSPRGRIPTWAWAGGGLLGVAVIGLVVVMGANMFGGNAATPTPTDAPTSAVQPTVLVAVTRAPTNTNVPPTARPSNTLRPTLVPPTNTSPPPTNTLPPPTNTFPPPTQGPSARITGISVSGDQYVIAFTVSGYNYGLPGPHVHFFFNTVAPERAGIGLPNAGPWELYGGPSPYTTNGPLMVSIRGAATAMCILVANPDHSIQLNTGNCVPLP
ncbi:MAG: serine/threonine-protein kinase [Anaerolineales bacterium]